MFLKIPASLKGADTFLFVSPSLRTALDRTEIAWEAEFITLEAYKAPPPGEPASVLGIVIVESEADTSLYGVATFPNKAAWTGILVDRSDTLSTFPELLNKLLAEDVPILVVNRAAEPLVLTWL